MSRIFLKPALDKSADAKPGARLKVRKPVGGHLAEAGEWQNKDSYWLRRLADKDVEEAQGPPEETATAPDAADAGGKAGSSSKPTK